MYSPTRVQRCTPLDYTFPVAYFDILQSFAIVFIYAKYKSYTSEVLKLLVPKFT